MGHVNSVISFSNAYGFCTYNQTVKGLLKNGADIQESIMGAHSTQGLRFIQNISIVLGAIPGIGTIVGIARIIFISKQMENLKRMGRISPEHHSMCKKDTSFWAGLMTRAVFEMLSLGSVLLIADIFATIFRSTRRIELPRAHFDTAI